MRLTEVSPISIYYACNGCTTYKRSESSASLNLSMCKIPAQILILLLSLGSIICGLSCKTLSCRWTTCPGCGEAVSRFTNKSIRIEGEPISVSFCRCPKGTLFAIWALCCGWHRAPSRLLETMRSFNVVGKIQDRYLKSSSSPSATPRGVGYGSDTDGVLGLPPFPPHSHKLVSSSSHQIVADEPWPLHWEHGLKYAEECQVSYTQPPKVEPPKQISLEDDPIQVSSQKFSPMHLYFAYTLP